MSNEVVEFVDLIGYDDYEILSQFPFTIRRKSTHHVIKESINSKGYVSVWVNNHKLEKHRLIAIQFIPNDEPEQKTIVDHINHDKTDYHLSNLRWTTISSNSMNRKSQNGILFEFVDDIPSESIAINEYETKQKHHEFNDGDYYYYFDESNNEDKFYAKITENLYKIMRLQTLKNGLQRITLTDINKQRVIVYIRQFKYQYGLIE